MRLYTSHLTAPSSYLEGPDAQHAERVDDFEGAEEILRYWDLAGVLGAALEGPDPDGVEIKVLTTEYEAVMDVALDAQHSLASSGVTEVLVSLPHMWYRNRNLLAWENSKS